MVQDPVALEKLKQLDILVNFSLDFLQYLVAALCDAHIMALESHGEVLH